jgi:hypothetical protein
VNEDNITGGLVFGEGGMRQILVYTTLAILLVTSLGLGYLYTDTNTKLSDLKTVSTNQNNRIQELESTLSAYRDAWELVNITKSYGSSYERAQISLTASYHSLYTTTINENGTLVSEYMHQPEYAYIYSPRDNTTLHINANLYESTRNIPITIFDSVEDVAASYSKPPLYSLEAKPNTYNEYNVVLPMKGWYSVSSMQQVIYSDPKYDYNIYVEMRLFDGVSFIPFVIREWPFLL